MRYVATRVIFAFLAFIVLITLDFFFVQVAPGDPAVAWLRAPPGFQLDANLVERVVQDWGLDKSVVDRYFIFLSNALRGNLGISFFHRGESVWDLVASRFANTLALMGVALAVAALVGIPLGRIAGGRRGRLLDSTIVIAALVAYSIPISLIGLALLYALVLQLQLLPLQGYYSVPYPEDFWSQLADRIVHGLLPLLVVIVSSFGFFFLAVRDSVGRASATETGPPVQPKLLRRWKQGMWDSRRAVFGTIAVHASWILGGIMMLEAFLGLDGLGRLAWRARQDLDLPLLSGVFLTGGLVTIVIASTADILFRYPAPTPQREAVPVGIPPPFVWRESLNVFVRALRRPMGITAVSVLVVLIGLTALAPILVDPSSLDVAFDQRFLPPSAGHPLGTNRLGQDLWALLLHGGEPLLWLALSAFLTTLMFGTLAGVSFGFFRGRWSTLAIWVVDFFLFIPWFLFVAMFVVVVAYQNPFDPSAIAVGIALLSSPLPVRMLFPESRAMSSRLGLYWVRGLGVKASAMRALRLSWALLPVTFAAALFAASLAVLMESLLAFSGLQLAIVPTWGGLLGQSLDSDSISRGAWWELLAPGLCITALVFALAMSSHVLREAVVMKVRGDIPEKDPSPDGPRKSGSR